MNRSRLLLVVVLVIAMMVAAAAPSAAAPPENKGQQRFMERVGLFFSDENEAPWAIQFMHRARVKNFMHGYPDGSFRPNASISQTEAVVTVLKFMGYGEDDLDDVDVEGYQGEWPEGIEAVEWAKAWLLIAEDEEIIELEGFQVNKAASRSWVCAILLEGLKTVMDEEIGASDLDLDILPFRDKDRIPVEHLEGVFWAWALEIVNGFPNGNFLPNKPLTRAEMSKILSESDIWSLLRGTVVKIDEDEITIKVRGNVEVTYDIAKDVEVRVADVSATLGDVEVGDVVHLDIEGEGEDAEVVAIYVMKGTAQVIILGGSDDDNEDDDEDDEDDEDDDEDDEDDDQ